MELKEAVKDFLSNILHEFSYHPFIAPYLGVDKENPPRHYIHQYEIVSRLALRRPIRVLIGDEIGLGKTITALMVSKYLERLNYLVDTTSEKDVRKRMSSSKMRQVKKGLKEGAEIVDPENIEQVKEFYKLLYYLYKYKVKKPLPEWSFFKSFYEQSKDGRLGIIKLIKYKDEIIGGILSPVLKNKVIYEWYICGMDREYKNLYPSVLATWAAIDYGVKNNLKIFDFMGVGVPDKDYGVREFKSKFGGEMVNYGRFGRINNKFLYAITEVGFNVLAWLKKI